MFHVEQEGPQRLFFQVFHVEHRRDFSSPKLGKTEKFSTADAVWRPQQNHAPSRVEVLADQPLPDARPLRVASGFHSRSQFSTAHLPYP